MKKTERPKNRYVSFEVLGKIENCQKPPNKLGGMLVFDRCDSTPLGISHQPPVETGGITRFEDWIYKEFLKFFGEYGYSKIGFKLIEYDSNKQIGIIRCNRKYVQKVIGFLALLNEPRVRTLKTSGIIKKLRKGLPSP